MSELTEPPEDWMQVTVVAPAGVASALLAFLQVEHDFVDIAPIDWCVLERRQDYARVDYAPCPPTTTNAYVVDWRRGESRGDVVVEIEERS
jgi:hypothetical protein